MLTLVLDPLWFLGVFAVLTALTPLAVAMVRRFGVLAAAFPLVVVAAADAVRFDLGGPSWAGWVNVVAGWMVPYLLGIAWARGAFPGRRGPALMLAGGIAATAALVLWAGYPASMVGVNGAAISNLNPPTLAVVTFGIAQAGLALLLREPLARLDAPPARLGGGRHGQPVGDDVVPLAPDRLPGGHHRRAGSSAGCRACTPPRYSGMWVAERLAWLPVFAVALAVLWLVFRRGPSAVRRRRARRRSLPARAWRRTVARARRSRPAGRIPATRLRRAPARAREWLAAQRMLSWVAMACWTRAISAFLVDPAAGRRTG